MARRLTAAHRDRLAALEARAERRRDYLTPTPLADVLALAGVTATDFYTDAAALTEPGGSDDAASVDAGVRVGHVLALARARLSGNPDPLPLLPVSEHAERPPGYVHTDGRYWHPGKSR